MLYSVESNRATMMCDSGRMNDAITLLRERLTPLVRIHAYFLARLQSRHDATVHATVATSNPNDTKRSSLSSLQAVGNTNTNTNKRNNMNMNVNSNEASRIAYAAKTEAGLDQLSRSLVLPSRPISRTDLLLKLTHTINTLHLPCVDWNALATLEANASRHTIPSRVAATTTATATAAAAAAVDDGVDTTVIISAEDADTMELADDGNESKEVKSIKGHTNGNINVNSIKNNNTTGRHGRNGSADRGRCSDISSLSQRNVPPMIATEATLPLDSPPPLSLSSSPRATNGDAHVSVPTVAVTSREIGIGAAADVTVANQPKSGVSPTVQRTSPIPSSPSQQSALQRSQSASTQPLSPIIAGTEYATAAPLSSHVDHTRVTPSSRAASLSEVMVSSADSLRALTTTPIMKVERVIDNPSSSSSLRTVAVTNQQKRKRVDNEPMVITSLSIGVAITTPMVVGKPTPQKKRESSPLTEEQPTVIATSITSLSSPSSKVAVDNDDDDARRLRRKITDDCPNTNNNHNNNNKTSGNSKNNDTTAIAPTPLSSSSSALIRESSAIHRDNSNNNVASPTLAGLSSLARSSSKSVAAASESSSSSSSRPHQQVAPIPTIINDTTTTSDNVSSSNPKDNHNNNDDNDNDNNNNDDGDSHVGKSRGGAAVKSTAKMKKKRPAATKSKASKKGNKSNATTNNTNGINFRAKIGVVPPAGVPPSSSASKMVI
jgi:hypothetical protein